MSIESLVTALKAKKFQVFYGPVPDSAFPPFIVLISVEHPNFGADNKTFTKTTTLDLRLVEAEVHDWTLIATLESALDEIGLAYSSTDLMDTAEGIVETNYSISFLGGNTDGE